MSVRLLISALLGGAVALAAGIGGPGLAVNASLPPLLRVGRAEASAPLIDLVVLGDSYASAATPFDRGTLNLVGAPSVCARGPAWPRLLDPASVRLSLTHVSCSGATIPDLLDRRMRAGEPVQIQALDAESDLVMLSIGGNDTGFSEVFAACRFESEARCAQVAARMSPRVDALTGSLVRLYEEVLRTAPNALVLVVLYADSLPNPGTPGLDACESLRVPGDELSDADLFVIEEWGRAISDRVAEAIAIVADPRLRVADLADAFAGHRICADEPWQWGRDGAIPFHPNPAGHAALAAELSKLLDQLAAAGAIPGAQ
ncbi:MAG: SGNH/GDSL hydrolase family protein [Candidatus Limnocylindrus sp.]